MKKIDLHLHLTPFQIPKMGKMNLASGKNMIPHLEELGIGKGVLMASSEKGLPFGTNKANKTICDKFPDRYAWMCTLKPEHPGKRGQFLQIHIRLSHGDDPRDDGGGRSYRRTDSRGHRPHPGPWR